MHASHFDAFLSAFTLTRSRRGLGSALAGLVLGGTLGSVGLEEAAAKKKNKNKKNPDCKKGKKRCGKFCISKELCCTSKDCQCGGVCDKEGICRPRSPEGPLMPCQTFTCNPSTNQYETVSCEVADRSLYCCEGTCKATFEPCCEYIGPEWQPCPGLGRCCDNLDYCTDDGSDCCDLGLKPGPSSCCLPNDPRC